MTRKAKAPASKNPAPPVDTPVEAEADEAPAGEVLDRPDGFYWRSHDGTREGGPFETSELARDDLEAGDAPDIGPVESLQEAESEIGVTDWIDPETGEPAEGASRPRLGEE
jgi:hypothetical protein